MVELDQYGNPQLLPKYAGGACQNPECKSANRYIRVMSTLELDRVHPSKKGLPAWPLPAVATHACEKCGYMYQGMTGQSAIKDESEIELYPLTQADWGFEVQDLYDLTVREGIELLVENRPDGSKAKDVEEAVCRWIPGAGRDDARNVMSDMDTDLDPFPIEEFM